MPEYRYRAKKGPEDMAEGTVTAESESAVITMLTAQGYFPVSIREAGRGQDRVSMIKKRISPKDVGLFTRQLADLLEGGLTLYQALDTIGRQIENKAFARIIQDIRDRVKEGNPLSDTIQKYPRLFSPLYVSMIRSGETGGMLDNILARLADFSDKEQELKSRLRGALTYPLFLGIFGTGTVTVLIAFVVPKLTGIFKDFGESLPLPTKILMAVSNSVTSYWWVILLFVIFIPLIFIQYKKSAEGRFTVDKMKLRIPVLGRLLLTGELSRLSRTLSTMLESGVPVLKSFDIAGDIAVNELLKRELINIHEAVSKGASMGEAMEQASLFPVFMTNMVKVGEKSGTVEKSLLKVADSYDKEIDRLTRVFTTLLEPVLILSLGVVVGFIVISMLLPIFNINLAVK